MPRKRPIIKETSPKIKNVERTDMNRGLRARARCAIAKEKE